MRALVINCSAPHYNLGARKLHDWLPSKGYTVTYSDGDPGIWGLDADLVCLSVIFSWHCIGYLAHPFEKKAVGACIASLFLSVRGD